MKLVTNKFSNLEIDSLFKYLKHARKKKFNDLRNYEYQFHKPTYWLLTF